MRLNLIYTGGGVSLSAASRIADRIRNFGWYLQLLADVLEIEGTLQELRRLRIPLVFDHIGHVPVAKGVRDSGFQALLELVRNGEAWVKLSAAYRLTNNEFPYEDVRPFVEALLDVGAGRLLWGTDWPHTVCQTQMPNDGQLLDLLHSWVSNDQMMQKVLVENPARLYA